MMTEYQGISLIKLCRGCVKLKAKNGCTRVFQAQIPEKSSNIYKKLLRLQLLIELRILGNSRLVLKKVKQLFSNFEAERWGKLSNLTLRPKKSLACKKQLV